MLWTWSDFFIVHFMEYNRDVDVGEQDINRPGWHLRKKNSTSPLTYCLAGKVLGFLNSWHVCGRSLSLE